MAAQVITEEQARRNPMEVRKLPLDRAALPKLPPAVISGVLRDGGTMMLSGGPKSGKSTLLMELAVAVASGESWLDFNCARGRVLYVNLKNDEPVFLHKFWDVWHRCMSKWEVGDEGQAASLMRLDTLTVKPSAGSAARIVAKLAEEFSKGEGYNVAIIDPIYRLQPLPENEPETIAKLCAQLDRLVDKLHCTLIYSHHHAKGDQTRRNAEDRAAGSTVFSRHADTIVDLIELEPDRNAIRARDDMKEYDACPYRMEIVARDFAPQDPLDIWFNYPEHWRDGGSLSDCESRKPGPRW